MKRQVALFIFLWTGILVLTAQNVKQDLLVCHVDGGPTLQTHFTQKVYAYHFLNGAYTGRDELMSFDGKKNGRDNIRTDKGKNLIYKNRFLVTGIGNIVDLKDKKILFDGKADLVRISNDSAIYYTNDAFKGKFYSYFNFKTLQYSEIKNLLFKALPGKDIEFEKSVKPFRINYYPQGKPKIVLSEDGGYGQQHISNSKYVPDPPLFWLDDSTFIYPQFNKSGTEINIQKVSIESARIKSLGTVSVSAGYAEAYWENVPGGIAVLHCTGSQVVVDYLKGIVTAPQFSPADHGFSYSLSDNKGRGILYNGNEIGKFSFDTENFRTTDNHAALIKLMIVGDETYQQGLQVWNSTTAKWQKVDAEEVTALLGWMQN